jgi:hypothetical protein
MNDMKNLLIALLFIVSCATAYAYRDLETGQFITRDPAGFVDGPNLYTYVLQDPWTHFDPEGLMTEDQYKQDIAENEKERDEYIRAHPIRYTSRGQVIPDGKRDAYNTVIKQDQEGIQRIEDYVGEFNAFQKLTGGTQITESQKATIDDARAQAGQAESQGQFQFEELQDFHELFGDAVTGVSWAAGGVVGEAAGLGFRAAAPYVSRVLGSFFKPALGKVLDVDATGFSGVYDSSTGKIALKPSSYDQPTPEGHVPARGGHGPVSQELGVIPVIILGLPSFRSQTAPCE